MNDALNAKSLMAVMIAAIMVLTGAVVSMSASSDADVETDGLELAVGGTYSGGTPDPDTIYTEIDGRIEDMNATESEPVKVMAGSHVYVYTELGYNVRDHPSFLEQWGAETYGNATELGEHNIMYKLQWDNTVVRQNSLHLIVVESVYDCVPEGTVLERVDLIVEDDAVADCESIYTSNGKVTLPGATMDGMFLAGWDVDGDGIEDAVPGDVIQVPSSGTVNAVWDERVQVTVNQFMEDDVVLSFQLPTDVSTGDTIVLPDATRPGFELAGWEVVLSSGQMRYMSLGSDGLYQPGDSIYVDESSVSITPRWTALAAGDDQHMITFDADGGDVPFDEWYVLDGQPMVLPESVRDGYNFEGWYDDDGNRVGEAGEVVYPTTDIALTAHWAPIDDSDGGDKTIIAIAAVIIIVVTVLILLLHYRFGVI